MPILEALVCTTSSEAAAPVEPEAATLVDAAADTDSPVPSASALVLSAVPFPIELTSALYSTLLSLLVFAHSLHILASV